MKYKIQFLFLLFTFTALTTTAQKKSMVNLSIRDNITYTHVDSAMIELLYQDTIKVSYQILKQENGNYQLEIDYRPGTYTILADKEGYTTGVKHFSLSSYRGSIVGAGLLLLEKERQIRMKNVTVTSTRIKMVMRGDTIVYDAAAFELAEGSMLDALVAQLPGAELVDGQIKVNGKVMESLLINGEEFFSGNPQIALQNLPSYSIKDIKVYNRESKDTYLKSEGRKMVEHEEHMVMDVSLKKKYMKGMIGNVDIGYGLPDNRYMGKAFGLGYFRHTRVGAFINTNNIKDTQTGTSNGTWRNGWNQEGELELKMGGIDIHYKRNEVEYNGNLHLTQEDAYIEKKTSSINYYETGDVYGRNETKTQQLRKHLVSNHNLRYSANQVYIEVTPGLDYLTDNNNIRIRQAEFSDAPKESYRMEALDSLFAPSWTTSRYARILLNRQMRETDESKSWLKSWGNARATVKLPHLANDLLKVMIGGRYQKDTYNPAMSYLRQYGAASANNGNGERQLQITDDVSKTYNVTGKISYDWLYTPYQVGRTHGWTITPEIGATRDYNDRSYAVNNLLEQYTEQNQEIPIIPPSAINPGLLALDRENSYNSVLTQDTYTPALNITYHLIPTITSSRQYYIVMRVQSQMQKEHLEFQKNQIDTAVARFSNIVSPDLRISYYEDNSKRNARWSLGYNYHESLPTIYLQIPTSLRLDPNNIFRSNPNLKRSQTHRVDFLYQDYRKTSFKYWGISAYYARTNRAMAGARRYDRDSGISIWQPENINGNWNSNLRANYSMPFGKGNAFQLSTNTYATFVHSVDYATDTEELTRSAVDNLNISEDLRITYKFGKQVIGWNGRISWLRSFSKREGFMESSALDVRTGIDATFNLPSNWQIVTDFNVLNRSGYADNTLNTTHCYWNASVSKSILKGDLTFKLDASDILNQISNVSHTINAQGQTETWVNTLPRFAMLHIIYKLNRTPKQ